MRRIWAAPTGVVHIIGARCLFLGHKPQQVALHQKGHSNHTFIQCKRCEVPLIKTKKGYIEYPAEFWS